MSTTKEIFEKLNDAFDQFKIGNTKTLDDIVERLGLVEAKAKLPQRVVVGATPEYDLSELNDQVRELVAGRIKAITIGTGTEGGNAAPSPVSDAIANEMRRMSPLIDEVLVEQSTTGQLSKVITDDSAAGGWAAESGTRNATATSVFNQPTLGGGMMYAYPTVTEEAVDDLGFNAGEFIVAESARIFAQQLGTAIVTGNGTARPFGFLNGGAVSPLTIVSTSDTASPIRPYGSIQYLPTGAAAGFQQDYYGGVASPEQDAIGCLFDALYALAPQYRANAVWAMNSTTLSTLAQLKDADGRPLLDGLRRGADDMILGKRVVVCEDMPDIAAAAHPVAVADFKRAYYVQMVGELKITVDESITTPGITKFYVRRRVRGAVLDDHAIKVVRCATF